MIRTLRVERFKSIVDQEVSLGRVNVFVGANGSGKSNLLEAMGVLGAAAGGRVDDEALLRRGVRPGLPRLYKSSFPNLPIQQHIGFGVRSERGAEYDATLWNPTKAPEPAWKFKSERLTDPAGKVLASRNPTLQLAHNQEQGIAALKTVELAPDEPARELVDELREFAIHCPNTQTLRGLTLDPQVRSPVGLAGGRVPEALAELQKLASDSESLADSLEQLTELIDWAIDATAAAPGTVALSPSASRPGPVVAFADRFMPKGRNRLTGYDASEGALFVLYYAILALHPKAPRCLAVDNLDQALNPRLATRLAQGLVKVLLARNDRQWIVTAQNPAVLDGLPLQHDEVRLFAVDRNTAGHTVVSRIDAAKALALRPDETWTLSRMWVSGLLGGVPSV